MLIASIIFGIISIIFFAIWVHAFTRMVRNEKPEIKKVDRTRKHARTVISPIGVSKEISIVKEKGYEVSMRGEMSYDQLADGVKKRDPGAFLFIRIAGGFGIGLISGISAIGSFVVHRGNNDGWALIITAAFFFSLFTFIIINQAVKRRSKLKDSSSSAE
jgi:preprotein translocase subunit YajC